MTLDELPSTPAKRPLPQAAAQTSKKQKSLQLVMGVDIEVHDWLEGPEKFPPWVQTTFGHRVRINIPTLSYQRVTQLGWSIYEDDGEGNEMKGNARVCFGSIVMRNDFKNRRNLPSGMRRRVFINRRYLPWL